MNPPMTTRLVVPLQHPENTTSTWLLSFPRQLLGSKIFSYATTKVATTMAVNRASPVSVRLEIQPLDLAENVMCEDTTKLLELKTMLAPGRTLNAVTVVFATLKTMLAPGRTLNA